MNEIPKSKLKGDSTAFTSHADLDDLSGAKNLTKLSNSPQTFDQPLIRRHAAP